MWVWRETLFAFLQRNCRALGRLFGVRPDRSSNRTEIEIWDTPLETSTVRCGWPASSSQAFVRGGRPNLRFPCHCYFQIYLLMVAETVSGFNGNAIPRIP